MGKKDIATKQYMRDPQHFADFFNGFIYNGEEVIDWNTLVEIDSSLCTGCGLCSKVCPVDAIN